MKPAGISCEPSVTCRQALAQKMADHPKHGQVLDKKTVELLYKSAPLHDIGKVPVFTKPFCTSSDQAHR